MGGYFHGWKRRIGILTLLMACVITAGWVRNSFFIESILVAFGRTSAAWLWSSDSALCLETHQIDDDVQLDDFPVFPQFFSRNRNFSEDSIWRNIEDPLFLLHRKWCGFGFDVNDDSTIRTVVPYWSLVLPTTLLSAWLLLSKPRQSTSKTIIEPTPEKLV